MAGERSRVRQHENAPAATEPDQSASASPRGRTSRLGGLRGRNRDVASADDAAGPSSSSRHRLPAGSARRWWPSVTALVAACALLAAVLVYVVRQPDVASTSARAAAVGSAQSTLETLLSYDYKTFDQHLEQVKPQLTAPFLDQFASVAGTELKALATTNETVVQARVYNVGVMDTTRDTVRVLAFVNQATTTKAKPNPAIDQNRVIATMKQVGDRWLISSLDAF